MIAPPMSLPPARRFWWWYAAAWLPLLAIYAWAYWEERSMGFASTVLAMLVNVLPDALPGVGVVLVCRRLWRDAKRGKRTRRIVLLALAFVLVATFAKAAANLLLMRSDGIPVDWASYDRRILLWQAFFSLLAFAVVASVTYGSSAAARLREEEARRSQAELLRARSELKALRAQLNPHFLFNTLHSLRALIGEDPHAAQEALEQLGDLLRYGVRIQGAEDEGVLLEEEWEFVRTYLALEKLRLGERLRVEEQVSPAALASVVPAFVLQPLVENAVRHGIAPSPRGGTIRIRAALEDGALCLDVQDDGLGANGAATKGTGKGLELVRQRLRALYGAAGAMEVRAPAGGGFAVTLRLPATLEPRSGESE